MSGNFGQKIDGRSEQGIDGWNIYLTKAISEEIAVPALNAPTISGPVLDSGKQYIILAWAHIQLVTRLLLMQSTQLPASSQVILGLT